MGEIRLLPVPTTDRPSRTDRFRILVLLFAAFGLPSLFCITLAGAQQVNRSVPEDEANRTYANLPSQPIGPNDLLALSVYDSPELSRTVRVDPGGSIRLPMLREPIKVEGMTPFQVETAVTHSLQMQNILVDPMVTVTIVEYQSRPINVVGAVKNPLVFQATQPVPLLDAIARSGGIREDAGSDILVSHDVTVDGKTQRVTATIPVRGLIDQADPKLNLILHGGEEVLVPEARLLYVVGNVKKPGAFPIRNDEQTTVMQVLALSEGLAPFPAKVAYVYRPSSSGPRREIPIPLEKILKRKLPDVALQANDILYIPDNRGRRLTAEAIDRITSLGGQTAANYVIWH